MGRRMGRYAPLLVRVSAMSWLFLSPAYRYGVGAQYICDQIGWGGFRLCYMMDDLFFG